MRLGHQASKDQNRDLFVVGAGHQVKTLFEVKTSADTQSLYTAVGQLMWHRHGASTVAVVIPSVVSNETRKRLRALEHRTG